MRFRTAEDLHIEIAECERQAGATADELRKMRETWAMSVEQRDLLSTIEDCEWLLGQEADQ